MRRWTIQSKCGWLNTISLRGIALLRRISSPQKNSCYTFNSSAFRQHGHDRGKKLKNSEKQEYAKVLSESSKSIQMRPNLAENILKLSKIRMGCTPKWDPLRLISKRSRSQCAEKGKQRSQKPHYSPQSRIFLLRFKVMGAYSAYNREWQGERLCKKQRCVAWRRLCSMLQLTNNF